jgi:Protein of unknown function (DUF2867)
MDLPFDASGWETAMRVPNAVHESRPWRIGEIAPDFALEDAWALPVYGGAGDFPALLEVMTSRDLAREASPVTRALFAVRWQLGRWFGWDRAAERPIPGRVSEAPEVSLAGRLPADLRGTAAGLKSGSPFSPLYRTDREFAAEISNQTVHGVLHLGWVDRGQGRYQGQLAVYVKPRGRFGRQYMAFITPFRRWIVYPALMRQIERVWQARGR